MNEEEGNVRFARGVCRANAEIKKNKKKNKKEPKRVRLIFF